MKNQKVIKELYKKFLINLDKENIIKNIISGSFSFKGNMVDKEICFAEFIKLINTDLNYKKIYISNPIICEKHKIIKYSVYVTLVVGIVEKDAFYPLIMGMKNLITYIDEDGWKIDSIESNLDYVKGNTEFLPLLKLKNKDKACNNKLEVIYGTSGKEDEMIRNQIYLLASSFDNLEARLLEDILSDTCKVFIKEETIANNLDEISGCMQEWNEKDATYMHAIAIKKVDINNDKAVVKAQRLQLDRIRSKSYNNATKNKLYYNAEIIFNLRKEETWKIYEIHNELKIIEEVMNDEVSYYEI